MRPVKILTDSCSDLTLELREKYDIDYCKMNTSYEGKETPASLDWEFYTPQELYGIMREGNRIFTTQVPEAEFTAKFTEYLEKGFDIVYIACCGKQSGSVNTGAMIGQRLMEKYEGSVVHSIDSLNACIGEGMIAIRAAEYRDQGLSADEIKEKLTLDLKTVNEYVTVHSLDALKRAGRVKASSAFFGNLLGVKPILIADKEGNQAALKKVKGRRASMQEIVNLLKETIVEPEKQTVYVLHADCMDEAKELEQMVREAIPNVGGTYISYIGPIIGASIGPDAVGVWAFGQEVTFLG